MAQDGMLPKVFGKLHPKSRAPWVAILALAIGWGLALNLGFERLVTLDIMIYGASLSLEFLALIFLRVREPELKRPFRVPGGLFGAIAVGIPPVLLLAFAVIRSEREVVLGMSALLFGLIVIGAGVLVYLINHALKPAGWSPVEPKPELAA
jgi:amino acid transporter